MSQANFAMLESSRRAFRVLRAVGCCSNVVDTARRTGARRPNAAHVFNACFYSGIEDLDLRDDAVTQSPNLPRGWT